MTSDRNELTLDYVGVQAARYACENWHYSETLPMPPMVRIGVWESGQFIGVVIFSRGAARNLFVLYGLKQTEGCELTRIALSRHVAPVSRIVKIAIMRLKEKAPGMRLIVSFADPSQGHHGGVYQAGNWIYSGDSSPSKQFLLNGRKLHNRQVSISGYTQEFGAVRKAPKPEDCDIVHMPGKHRYLMPLDKDMRQKLVSLSRPYPKRTKKQDSKDHLELEGANPICTLQIMSE